MLACHWMLYVELRSPDDHSILTDNVYLFWYSKYFSLSSKIWTGLNPVMLVAWHKNHFSTCCYQSNKINRLKSIFPSEQVFKSKSVDKETVERARTRLNISPFENAGKISVIRLTSWITENYVVYRAYHATLAVQMSQEISNVLNRKLNHL